MRGLNSVNDHFNKKVDSKNFSRKILIIWEYCIEAIDGTVCSKDVTISEDKLTTVVIYKSNCKAKFDTIVKPVGIKNLLSIPSVLFNYGLAAFINNETS